MPISFQKLRTVIKSTGIPTYRDEAPMSQEDYPYIIYEFVNETNKKASNKILYDQPLYMIAVITDGTESDIEPLKEVFKNNDVMFTGFVGGPYEPENDSLITQYVTYVRCLNG